MAKQIKPTPITLSGYIHSKIPKTGLANLTIEAWDKDNLKDDCLGKAIADAKGYFSIQIVQQKEGWNLKDRKPDIYFKIFSGDKLLHHTQDNILWNTNTNKTEIEILIDMENDNNPNMGTTPIVTVNGTKISGFIDAINNEVLTRTNFETLVVKVFQTTLTDEKELASNDVKEDGSFETVVEVPKSCSLLARLYQKTNSKKLRLIAESGPHCPKENSTIRFDYDVLKNGQPLFTELHTRVAPHIGKLRLKDIDKAQLQKLECIAGVSALALSRLVNTDRLVHELKTAVQKKRDNKDFVDKKNPVLPINTNPLPLEVEAVMFALLKNDYLISLPKLLSLSAKQLEAKLQNAVKENEIGILPNQVEINNLLINARDILLLNATADDDNYDAKLIHISSATNPVKTNLLNIVIDAGGLRNWLVDRKGVNEKEQKQTTASVKKVKAKTSATSFNKDISALMRNELGAIMELDEQLRKFPPLLAVTVNEVRNKNGEIDLSKLAGKTEAYWLSLIKKMADKKQFPNTYPDNKESLNIYAKDIVKSFAAKFPALTLLSKIGDSKMEKKAVFKSILTKNPDFDITKQSVNTWFKVAEKPAAANEISAKNLQQLQLLQRCIKLTDGLHNINHTEALLQSGIESSHHITRMGKYAFTQTMKKLKVNETESIAIYNKAQHTTNTVKMLAVNYIRYERKESLMPRFLQFDQLKADDALGLPDMESIFGNLNSCSCSHCQSVYSAAAYLTDLLHWIKSDIVCKESGINGYAALSGTATMPRRKDISYILLNCKNTNELLPYIDLVNEILSINLFKSPDYSVLQTTKNSKQLIAEPEHRFETEWQLTRAFFPFTLPYDANWDAASTYLKEMGVQQHELINGFSKIADNYNSAAWAKAYLGFNDAEFDLVKLKHTVAGETDFWTKYWGLTAMPKNVGAILKSTSLSLAELKEYLSSFYISQSKTAIEVIAPAEDDCNLDRYELSEPFTIVIADRFMRFMRIRRKTNLSVWELDIAISNFGNNIDESFLVQLASVLAFCKEHNISFTEALIWFSEKAYQDAFNSSKTSAYYENTYRSTTLSNDTRNFFNTTLTSGNCIYTAIGIMTDENKIHVCSVLNITDIEFNYLTDFIGYDMGDYLTLTNLAAYHRHVSFCRAFGIAIVELGNLFGGISLIANPFIGVGTSIQKIWNFKNKWNDFKLLDQNPLELSQLVLGAGKYKLKTSGLAIYSSFAKEAHDLWIKIQDALTNTRKANPQAYIEATTGKVLKYPVETADIDLFKDIIVTQISDELGLNKKNVNELINQYSTIWLYKNTYYNVLTPLAWTTANAGDFTKLYRFLLRVSALTRICGLTDEGLDEAIKQEYSGTSPLFKSAFYWLKNNFTISAFIPHLVWIKKGTEQATAMGITQEEYFKYCADIDTYTFDFFTNPPISITTALYNAMDNESSFRKMSVYQFSEMYVKAQTIADTPTNLVSVLEACISMIQTCTVANLNFEDAWRWTYQPTGTTGIFQNVSIANYQNDIKRVLRSKYATDDAWYKFITPIHNGLRMRLRDALVAYYIGQKGFENSNAIYAHFLLDSEMEPCMKTSRIVQAISSVQLLIHRGLMGLEPQMCMDEDDKKEWEWRKNYRVWEANRKVFLYPENWIEPSLRLDKTPFFKELEDILAQDEINTANAEKAFSNYLGNLNKVARLDIRGTYIEEVDYSDSSNSLILPTIHVFARTWNAPFSYYYRKSVNSIWSAWEKLELDIEGDHLIPMMFNRRLYLFWPLFIEKEHRTIKALVDGVNQNAPYYEVKMCYSKLEFGKWTSKKILDGTMLAGSVSGPGVYNDLIRKLDPELALTLIRPNLVLENANFKDYSMVKTNKDSFFFWAEKKDSGDLIIHCRREYKERWVLLLGYTDFAYEDSFLISACDEKVEIIPPVITEIDLDARRLVLRPWLTKPRAMQLINGLDNNDVMLPNEEGLYLRFSSTATIDKSSRIFNKTPSTYTLTYPHQYKHASGNLPFFYSDKKHTFLLRGFYSRQSHEHPFSCLMLSEFNKKGIDGLLNTQNPDIKRQLKFEDYFRSDYQPFNHFWSYLYPANIYDFSLSGAYSIYNWEIFFHTVSLIARQLRQNNKFAEAIRWLQFVFDPTNREAEYGNLRYWKIKPFMKDVTEGSIQKLMQMLSGTSNDSIDVQKRAELAKQIEEWRDHPFDPHKIASMRNRAYMLWTVMEYIETLTDWADSLFRQFTMESVNEAINLYVLASELLGKRPKQVEKAKSTDISFNEIENNLDAFSNTAVAIETIMAMDDHMPLNGPGYGLPELVFCIPENPKLKELWDRVEDRLFKIRHCMNIEGKKVELALFQPPIDPALLVRARAMGMDLADILSDLAAPSPHYRFSFLVQKANEFCNEVKSLGGQLLSALEKKDGEELALIRQVHEQNILKAARNIKKIQIDDAKNNYASLQHSKKLIEIRLNDYSNREFISSKEGKTISLTKQAEGFMYTEQGANLVASFLTYIPDAFVGFPSNFVKAVGGAKISDSAKLIGGASGIISSVYRNMASMSSTYAGYDRRQEEWNLQIKTATEELNQMEKQLLGAEIRIAITEKELDNHDLQVEQSIEMYEHLKSKFSNLQLYTWMSGELMKLNRQSYELAYDMAKQAQQAYYKELGQTEDSIINFGHWDSSKKGLLAGEKLSLQLKQLDAAYIKNNIREYEVTKHISLSLLDPLALISLRNAGNCEFEIPEVIYDLDYPGHYFRRIKSVSISMPCIAGPFTSVNAKLSLEKHEIRRKDNLTDPLDVVLGFTESIVTSSAQNDSGVFELNFRDERYVPFEGAGAISRWNLEFTEAKKQFDYNTIADAVLHVKYTAREGSSGLKTAVNNSLKDRLALIKQQLGEEGLHIAINMKHDMPNEWHMLKKDGIAVNLKIDKSRLPYVAQALSPMIESVQFIAKTDGISDDFDIDVTPVPITDPVTPSVINLLNEPTWNLCIGKISFIELGNSYTLKTVSDKTNLKELIMIVKYKF